MLISESIKSLFCQSFTPNQIRIGVRRFSANESVSANIYLLTCLHGERTYTDAIFARKKSPSFTKKLKWEQKLSFEVCRMTKEKHDMH